MIDLESVAYIYGEVLYVITYDVERHIKINTLHFLSQSFTNLKWKENNRAKGAVSIKTVEFPNLLFLDAVGNC